MPERTAAVALVAEDEALVRMDAADMLGDAGFDVYEASTAASALAYLEGHPEVALLFTDVRMPGPLDGLALAHEVRGRWPHVRVIVVSGYEAPTAAQLPEGVRFLEKPYQIAQVAKVLGEMGLRVA